MKTDKKSINKKADALRNKTEAELKLLLREHSSTLLSMRLARRSGSVEKTHLFRQLRREVARIQTILSQKSA